MKLINKYYKIFIALFFINMFSFTVLAVPNVIPFTGQVKVNGDDFTGTGTFRFAIVNTECVSNISGCVTLWSNDGTSTVGSEPTNGVSIVVNNGSYSIGVGSISTVNMTEVPASVFNSNITFLRVWFDDGVTGSQLLTPDRQLVSVPYAYRAKVADSLSINSTYSSLPVGTVIDWWRPSDSTTSLPEGFVVCDGSVVSDTESPYDGKAVPNLTDTFVRGVTDVNNIGQSGGSINHSHTTDINHDHASENVLTSNAGSHNHVTNINHNHASSFSASTGSHNHSVSIGHDHPSVSTNSDTHNHVSFSFDTATNIWRDGLGGIVTDWADGMDSLGSGDMPISVKDTTTSKSLFTNNDTHSHSVNLPSVSITKASSTSGSHSHNVDLPALGTTNIQSSSATSHNHSASVDLSALGATNGLSTTSENLPPYVGLLKLIKIK